MHTVIVNIYGGVVQDVYCDAKEIRVIKIDWDAGESPGDEVDVGEFFVSSMSDLPLEMQKLVESAGE